MFVNVWIESWSWLIWALCFVFANLWCLTWCLYYSEMWSSLISFLRCCLIELISFFMGELIISFFFLATIFGSINPCRWLHVFATLFNLCATYLSSSYMCCYLLVVFFFIRFDLENSRMNAFKGVECNTHNTFCVLRSAKW